MMICSGPFPETGQTVDGPQYGTSPPPWDIPVSMPQRYTDMVEKVRVPHSSFVKVQSFLIVADSRAVSELAFHDKVTCVLDVSPVQRLWKNSVCCLQR